MLLRLFGSVCLCLHEFECVCLFAYVWVCLVVIVCVCVCWRVFAFVWACLRWFRFACDCLCVFSCACLSLRVLAGVCAFLHLLGCVCVCACVFVCLHVGHSMPLRHDFVVTTFDCAQNRLKCSFWWCDQRRQNVPSEKKLFFKFLPKIDFFQKIDFLDLKKDF